jgi:hypothetical protein
MPMVQPGLVISGGDQPKLLKLWGLAKTAIPSSAFVGTASAEEVELFAAFSRASSFMSAAPIGC